MIINTKYFGEITVSDDKEIVFPGGLFGFPDSKSFFMLSFDEAESEGSYDQDLMCLQSATEPYLAFVIVNPFAVVPNYEPLLLTGDDLTEIGSSPNDSLVFYSIAVIRDNMKESTINLKCPIVINPSNKKAKQIIFEEGEYSLRYPLIPEDSSHDLPPNAGGEVSKC